MQIKILPLNLYVEKYVERLRIGSQYRVDDRLIYRIRGNDGEDVGELPAPLDSIDVVPFDFPGGTYVGDRDAIDRLRPLVRRLRDTLEQIESQLRQ